MAKRVNHFKIKGRYYTKYVGVNAFFTETEIKNAKARFRKLKKYGGKR